jgi:hypothetical protein
LPGSLKGSEAVRTIPFDDIAAVSVLHVPMRFRRVNNTISKRANVYEIHLLVRGKRPCDYVLSQDENEEKTYKIAIRLSEFLNVQIVDEEAPYRHIVERVSEEPAPPASAAERPILSLYGSGKAPAIHHVRVESSRLILKHHSVGWASGAFFLFNVTAIVLFAVNAGERYTIFPEWSWYAQKIASLIVILMLVSVPLYIGYLFWALHATARFDRAQKCLMSFRYLLFEITMYWPSKVAERIIPLEDITRVRLTPKGMVVLMMNQRHDADYIVSADKRHARAEELARTIAEFLSVELVEAPPEPSDTV